MANDYKSQTCKNCKYHFCYQEESSECSSADTHPAATMQVGSLYVYSRFTLGRRTRGLL